MTTHRLVSVRSDDDVAFAARLMRWAGVRHLPVIKGCTVVGVFTERDYLRYRAETGSELGFDPVSRFMASPAETISPDDLAAVASALMLSHGVGCLPVVADGELVGMVTANDILTADVRATAPPLSLDAPVSQVMTRNPAVLQPYESLAEAVALMTEQRVRHIPVTDPEGRLVGMLCDSNIRATIGDPVEALRGEIPGPAELQVSMAMTSPAESVSEDAPLSIVAERLAQAPIGALPVIDRMGCVAGVVSYVDVVRALLDPPVSPFNAGVQPPQRSR